MKNQRTIRYLSGVCFIITAIIRLINMANYEPAAWDFLFLIGIGLVAASLFTSKRILFTIGSAACVIVQIHSTVSSLNFYRTIAPYNSNNPTVSLFFVVVPILSLIFYVLLFVSGLGQNIARPLGIIAGIVAGIICIASLYRSITSLTNILLQVALVVGTILYALSNTTVKKAVNKTLSPSTESQADRLIKLQTLLSNGVITQEEFNAKKQEILKF